MKLFAALNMEFAFHYTQEITLQMLSLLPLFLLRLFLCLGNLVPNLMVSRNLVQTRFAPLLYLKKKTYRIMFIHPGVKKTAVEQYSISISLFNPKSLCESCVSKRERFS